MKDKNNVVEDFIVETEVNEPVNSYELLLSSDDQPESNNPY